MQRQMLDFFLGAVSPAGFAGYFDQLLRLEPSWRVLLIKGGPGCGKSTLMRRIAQAFFLKGEQVERIHCSSDPDSLDGVICPKQRFAIVDATAPHVLEPRVPVAAQEVVSLYDYLDRDSLQSSRDEISLLFDRCSLLQERAARYVTAAAGLITDSARIGLASANLPAAQTFAQKLASRRLPATSRPPQEQIRLLSANTPNGRTIYRSTVDLLADTVLVLEDEEGAVSKAMMQTLRQAALARGQRFYTCYCPLAPCDKIDHLLFPNLSLAIVTSNSWHPFAAKNSRVIHCRRFCQKELLANYRHRLRFNRKTANCLLEQASDLQRQAKQLHDQLEVYYKTAADFAAIDQLTSRLLQDLSKEEKA